MNDKKQMILGLMGEIFHYTRLYLDKKFSDMGLSRPEWLLLAMLRLHPDGVSQSEARKYIGIEKSYFTKILNRLEEKLLIVREVDSNNRRNRIISVNPHSKKKLKTIFQLLETYTDDVQVSLSDQEVNRLYKSLLKIRDGVPSL